MVRSLFCCSVMFLLGILAYQYIGSKYPDIEQLICEKKIKIISMIVTVLVIVFQFFAHISKSQDIPFAIFMILVSMLSMSVCGRLRHDRYRVQMEGLNVNNTLLNCLIVLFFLSFAPLSFQFFLQNVISQDIFFKLIIAFFSAYTVLVPFIPVILVTSLRRAIKKDIIELRTKFYSTLCWYATTQNNFGVTYQVNENRIMIAEAS